MKHNRRTYLIGSVLSLFLVLISSPMASAQNPLNQTFQQIRNGRVKVIDLTYAVNEHTPYWPESTPGSPFHASTEATYQRDGYYARLLTMPEHFGTHMDAPVHFDPKGKTVDEIPVTEFLTPAVMIDVSRAVGSDADYRISAQDVEKWVKAHGAIPQHALVLFRTGWGSRWPSQKRYMNPDAKGVLHFPGLSVASARYLLDHAHPVGIGIDTGSIDYGASKNFPVHHLTLGHGLYHLENVANLGKLPATGFFVIALPLKLKGGSGSPVRVLALVPRR